MMEALFYKLETFVKPGAVTLSEAKGPAGGVDFVFQNKLFEIKTTIKDKHQYTVNGINQLDHNELTVVLQPLANQS